MAEHQMSLSDVIQRLHELLEAEREALVSGDYKSIAAFTKERVGLTTAMGRLIDNLTANDAPGLPDVLADIIALLERNQRLIMACKEGRLRRLKVISNHQQRNAPISYGGNGHLNDGQKSRFLAHAYQRHVVDHIL